MTRYLTIATLLLAALLFVSQDDADAIGRGGGAGGKGGAGGGAGRGDGGGGGAGPAARPAPRPAPAPRPSPAQRPASGPPPAQRPSAAARPAPAPRPSINRPTPQTRPATAQAPSFGPGPASHQAARPASMPARPNTPAVQKRPDIAQPKTRPGGNDFGLPGNFNRPNSDQIARPNRPDVTRPGQGKGGTQIAGDGRLPDFNKKGSKSPDFKKDGKFPNFNDKTRPGPKNDPRIADLKKKQPGLFPDKRPDIRPSRDEIGDWVSLPKNRPDGIRPDGVGPAKRPSTRPGIRPDNQITKDFANNWQSAIYKGKKTNIGNTRIGDINIDMSKNINYQNLNRHVSNINNNFRPVQSNWFNNEWWGNQHQGGGYWPDWHYHHSHPPSYWWRPATWGAFTGWMGASAWSPPVYYDYGGGYGGGSDYGASPVVIQQDVVYVNDQPVASAPVYAEQAIQLASVEPPPEPARVEWLPLGTFAMMATKDDDDPSVIMQLAVSKDGLVSGTWYNRATDTTSDLEGRVDPQTQRIAVRKPDEPDVVIEAGVYNLTQGASSCLIHYGTLNTQTRWLARLENQQS